MVTRKKPKIATFSFFYFLCVIILFVIEVDTSLRCQIKVFTMPHTLRTCGYYFV